jgi:hypothetical protein
LDKKILVIDDSTVRQQALTPKANQGRCSQPRRSAAQGWIVKSFESEPLIAALRKLTLA